MVHVNPDDPTSRPLTEMESDRREKTHEAAVGPADTMKGYK
jgi:hypothetical protein